LRLIDVRVNAWEMDPVDPELLAKVVVLQSRFMNLYEYLIRKPEFLPEVEKAVIDPKFTGDLPPGISDTLLGAQDGWA
jgi:hypothetical protein